MNLTDKDLKQIDKEYLLSLSREELEKLSKKLLDDLRLSRDRQNMNTEFSPLRQAQGSPEPADCTSASSPSLSNRTPKSQ